MSLSARVQLQELTSTFPKNHRSHKRSTPVSGAVFIEGSHTFMLLIVPTAANKILVEWAVDLPEGAFAEFESRAFIILIILNGEHHITKLSHIFYLLF